MHLLAAERCFLLSENVRKTRIQQENKSFREICIGASTHAHETRKTAENNLHASPSDADELLTSPLCLKPTISLRHAERIEIKDIK